MDLIKVEVVGKNAYYSINKGDETMHDQGDIIDFNKAHMSTLKSNIGTKDQEKKYLPTWAKAVGKGVATRPAHNPSVMQKPIALSEMAKQISPAVKKEMDDFAKEKAAFKKEKEEFNASKGTIKK